MIAAPTGGQEDHPGPTSSSDPSPSDSPTPTSYGFEILDLPAGAGQNQRRYSEVDPLFRRDDDYCRDYVMTYGPTVKESFKKEYLERRFDIYRRPSMMNKTVVLLMALTELAVLGHLAQVYLHSYTKPDMNLFRNSSETGLSCVPGNGSSGGDSVDKSCRGGLTTTTTTTTTTMTTTPLEDVHKHLQLGNVCFAFLVPHMAVVRLFLNLLGIWNVTVWMSGLKIATFCLFLFHGNLKLHLHRSSALSEESEDVRRALLLDVHVNLATILSAMFNLYLILLAVEVAVFFCPVLKGDKLRAKAGPVVSLLDFLVEEYYLDCYYFLLNASALLAIISGYFAYFCRMDLNVDDAQAPVDGFSSTIVTLALIQVFMAFMEGKRHNLVYHDSYITRKQFGAIFLRFKKLYCDQDYPKGMQPPNRQSPQIEILPKINSSIRMV